MKLGEDEVQKKLSEFVGFARRLDRLSKEHKDLQRALREVQRTTAFYQSRFQKADQVMRAVKQGYVPTPSFMPKFLEDKGYLQMIRHLCSQAVYSKWNQEKAASSLMDIYLFVKKRIRQRVALGEWNPKVWRVPGKRTVDRRTNEAADPRFWGDGVTPIIAVKAGLYMPNPSVFDAETRVELERLLGEWKRRN